jgi:hypothetical protein
MIRDGRSSSLTTKRPPDRGGNACAATATDGAERVPSSQLPAVTIARRLVWRRLRLPLSFGLSRGCIGNGCRGIQYP